MATKVSYPESAHRVLAELEETSFWFNHRNDIIRTAASRFPPAGRMYDVGGGNGFVSVALREAGIEATVVEPGSDGAATARSRNLEVIEQPYQDLEIPPGSLGGIGAFDVIEHIEADKAVMEGFFEDLMPGGRLYIAVPSFQWLWSSEDVIAGHFRRYTLPQLKQLTEGAGFTPLYETYFFSFLVPPLFGLRTLPSLLGLRTTRSDPKTIAREHAPPSGAVKKVLDSMMRYELRRVIAGKSIPFGTSALIIAEKPVLS